jgi:dUTP pyrophosphatase
MKVEFKLKLNGVTPSKAHDCDAGFDIYSSESKLIPANSMATVMTGLFVSIPEGYVGLLFSRSGMGRNGIRLSNCVGVIDSGYQGEIGVMLHNDGSINKYIDPNNKIAQLVILQLPEINLKFVDNFSTETARGENGFGSTGL